MGTFWCFDVIAFIIITFNYMYTAFFYHVNLFFVISILLELHLFTLLLLSD